MGEWPILNLTLLAWGIPTLLSVLALAFPWPIRSGCAGSVRCLYFQRHALSHPDGAAVVAGGRYLRVFAVSNGEQYSYSAVWLLTAIVLIFIRRLVGRRPGASGGAVDPAGGCAEDIPLGYGRSGRSLPGGIVSPGLGLCLVGLGWFISTLCYRSPPSVTRAR